MAWQRLGLLFPPRAIGAWSATHAALPLLDPVEPLLYFTARDRDGRGHIGRLGVDLERGITCPPGPRLVLAPGTLGAFDDSGVTGSCVVIAGGERRLYYTGWMRGVTVPFYLAVGLAAARDGDERFERISAAPVLERSAADPYLTASPWVLHDGGRWRMWYVSGVGWDSTPAGPRHRYHIRYAESSDGIVWKREGRVAIDFGSPAEYAFGRPCVIKEGDIYRMWFCHRGDTYRLGYAESSDGMSWTRHDDRAGLDPAESGFDHDMVAYPAVYDRHGVRWMLYNGNGYGLTGIGLAKAATGRS